MRMLHVTNLSLAMTCGLAALAAFAQSEGAESLSLEALSPSGDEALFGFLGSGFYLLAVILALLIVIALVSGFRKPLPEAPSGGAARNLFLAFRFTKRQNGCDVNAHLRALDLHAATFVAPCALQRGEEVRLYVGSLPNYPEHNATIDASVTSCIPLGGVPESYLVKAKFQPPSRMIMKSCLPSYLHKLTQPSRFIHA